VLCGKITISGTSDSNETLESSQQYVFKLIDEINSSAKVKVEWIQGAYGAEKEKLFKEADIFVFPSRYSVEAQPIVLIEAMASGTAIITSSVGEIPSTVSEKNAIVLDKPSSENIANAILEISIEQIDQMKHEGLELFNTSFSKNVYKENWNSLFSILAGNVDTGCDAYCNLTEFDNHDFNRGRPYIVELLWVCMRGVFFKLIYLPIYRIRRVILRFFGAVIGRNVIIKPTAKITFPWRLTIGENSWIGEDAWILNLYHVTIGNNVIISQKAFLCTGNHDWSKAGFDLLLKPIVIENGVWIGASVTVLPGVRIGCNSIVTAGSVVTEDLPPGMICSGNPCKPVKKRNFKANRS